MQVAALQMILQRYVNTSHLVSLFKEMFTIPTGFSIFPKKLWKSITSIFFNMLEKCVKGDGQ